ncbi:Receptor-interacting serine/threonine-protein kinase 2 [Chelonia mydas]|uniref:Receptor-interacting serine/threonine-protein kinase 2 n=1 Tax=Chelonia mydas TaxID=8469 RepID=M7C9D6_CHEMY|nr:Receptor-interacting serine/threonine-protein kinase 2 [Chelonia mydas]
MPVESGLSQEEEILDEEGEGDPEAEDDSEARDACSREFFSTPEEPSQSQQSELGEAQTGEEAPVLSPTKRQKMANLMPVIAQEELDHFIFTRTSSGFTLKAFHAPQNINISLKLLTSQNTTESELKVLLQDVANTRRIQSEQLLPSLGIYQSQGLLGVVTEWMSNGSLHSLIHELIRSDHSPYNVHDNQGKKNLLEVVTGVCNGLRPGTEAEYIQSSLPQRNRLLQLIILCWHQDPDYRPQTAECAELLKRILSTFSKEKISSAIYSLIDAKERAVNASKGSVPHVLQTHVHNLEVLCAQKNSNRLIDKRVPLTAQRLSTVLDSPAGREKANQMALADITAPNTTQKRGPCCKGSCCQILACGRQTILSCMTEGRLNHILDVLRSQRVLSKMDYEMITSFPTLTSRARALLDTCLCLGEGAAQIVVTVLSTSKCSPLARGSHITDSPAKLNRRLQ